MMNSFDMKVAILGLVALVGATAWAGKTCHEYGCKRHALPNGYCEVHQKEYKQAMAKRAQERAELREARREHAAAVRANEEAAAEIEAQAAAKERQLRNEQRKRKLEEQKKFEMPLTGLFGVRFGTAQEPGEVAFEPETTYRHFKDYRKLAEGTNGVVKISARAEFGSDAQIARRELNLVLEDVAAKHGRTPYKVFTRNGDEVWGLGFGGVKGVAHQQLQVSFEPNGTGYLIEISGFVIRDPDKTVRRWDDAKGGFLGETENKKGK